MTELAGFVEGKSIGELIYDEMKRSRLEYCAKYAPERLDEMKAKMKEEEKAKIKENEEKLRKLEE